MSRLNKSDVLSFEDVRYMNSPIPVTLEIHSCTKGDGFTAEKQTIPMNVPSVPAVVCPDQTGCAKIMAMWQSTPQADVILIDITVISDDYAMLTTSRLINGSQGKVWHPIHVYTVTPDDLKIRKTYTKQNDRCISVITPHGVLTAGPCPDEKRDGIQVSMRKADGSLLPLSVTEYIPDGQPTCQFTGCTESMRAEDRQVPSQRRRRNTDDPEAPWHKQHCITEGFVTSVYPDGAQLTDNMTEATRTRVFHYDYLQQYSPSARTFMYLLKIYQECDGKSVPCLVRSDGTNCFAYVRPSPNHPNAQTRLLASTEPHGDAPVVGQALMNTYANDYVVIQPYFAEGGRLVNLTIQTMNPKENGYHGVLFMVDTPPELHLFVDGDRDDIIDVKTQTTQEGQ